MSRVEKIRNALNAGSRTECRWVYTDCRGHRQFAIGKAVTIVTTWRGVSIKLNTGKTIVVRCSKNEVCELFNL